MSLNPLRMRRPSQWMLAFVVVAGGVFGVFGDRLTPRPTASRTTAESSRQHAARQLRSAESAVATNDLATTTEPTGDRPTQPAVGPGPWILRGLVRRECADSTPELGVGVGLELVPVGSGRHTAQALLSTTSDPTGAYQWAGLLPGTYRVRALPDRASTQHLPIAYDVELPKSRDRTPGATSLLERDVLLPIPRTLQGSIANTESAPLGPVLVSISETGMHRGTATADPDGNFTIDGVGTGPYEVRVRTQAGKSVKIAHIETVQAEEPNGSPRIAIAVALP